MTSEEVRSQGFLIFWELFVRDFGAVVQTGGRCCVTCHGVASFVRQVGDSCQQ